MRAPDPTAPTSQPGGVHLMACGFALAASVARLEHLSCLLRLNPQDGQTVDHLFKLVGVYWSEAAQHYEAYRQISQCEGKA